MNLLALEIISCNQNPNEARICFDSCCIAAKSLIRIPCTDVSQQMTC